MFFSNADIVEYNNEKYVVVATHKDKVMNKVFALACLLSYNDAFHSLIKFSFTSI